MNQPSRKRNPLSQFREAFCPTLMNRLYPRIKWYMDVQDTYLLFINILDRTDEASIQQENLIYAGIEAQLALLPSGTSDLSENWKFLHWDSLHIEESNESKKTINRISNKTYSLDNIRVKHLRDYFGKYYDKGTFANKEQANEYPILDHYFDINSDHYLSLPIIQFGWVDGMVHIIFKNQDLQALNDRTNWSKLIKLFSIEYEALLINWDLANSNTSWHSIVHEDMQFIESEEYIKMSQQNPIFRELNYRDYYRNARNYYKQRLKSNGLLLKDEHRKRAIITILIDSFSHNVSAHSLTVLKWWFQQRGNYQNIDKAKEELLRKFPFENWGEPLSKFLSGHFNSDYFTQEEIAEGIKTEVVRWYGQLLDRRDGKTSFRAVRDQVFSLSSQLAPLFKYLLEKGAFWSGITRDKHFGGGLRNLYDLIWNDFLQNTLYLGTIAYAEGITKLKIKIRVYSGNKLTADEDVFRRLYEIKKNDDGELLDGLFGLIDIVGRPEQALQTQFLIKGEKHDILQKELKDYEIFLPGGMVGKHALYTLIENEIRNVRHYDREDLTDMQENGLDLLISVRPSALPKSIRYEDKSLYKIGIWIEKPSNLYNGDEHYLSTRFAKLMEDIITEETHRPKLGGAFQDKICAAMLFNGTFNSVEHRNTPRDQYYYPWIRAAFSEALNEEKEAVNEVDFEIQARNKVRADIQLLNKRSNPAKGFIKKYFHLWAGANIFHVKDRTALEEENVSRFRLVNILHDDQQLRLEVRREGTIRVMSKLEPEVSWESAYRAWLMYWLKDKIGRIRFLRRHTEVGHLIFDREDITFYNQDEYNNDQQRQEEYADYPVWDLNFGHYLSLTDIEETQGILQMRSDGILLKAFFEKTDDFYQMTQASLQKSKLYELLEVLQTRICIFDRRIADRLSSTKRATLWQQLDCAIFGESQSDWEKLKEEGFNKFHFVIVHLAFIESYLDNQGKHYGEEGVVRFVEEQLHGQLGESCILVVTTGRGRERWWKRLRESKYANQVTFRPVEMLINAVEKAGLIKDDIELKYNLVKVLFGS